MGATSETAPKYVSPVYAYCTNYLIDLDHAAIVDVESFTAIRQGSGRRRPGP